MKLKFPIWIMAMFLSYGARSQGIDKLITLDKVTEVEKVLSSDSMKGRQINTPGIEKAADFISREFREAGLESLHPDGGYRQEFIMVHPRLTRISCTLDGQKLDPSRVFLFSSRKEISMSGASPCRKIFVRPGESLFRAAIASMQVKEDLMVLVDSSFAPQFARLGLLRDHQFRTDRNLVFILTGTDPRSYSIEASQEITEMKLANIVGVIPGKSKKDEYVIFSAHYDHLGTHASPGQADSIFNGANDDASGVTAVISLARYFSKVRSNEYTLVFVAFTAEEIGEYGSAYFATQFVPAKVAAMFNIEMIGTESKWGTRSAYITGFDFSDMGKIMNRNLEGTPYRFYPDPYPQQQLFYRSDNASLARLGVPAHTVSTSKMDDEKLYHTVSDEIGTLDLQNMTEIIRAIALSAGSIVEGKDVPSRVTGSPRN